MSYRGRFSVFLLLLLLIHAAGAAETRGDYLTVKIAVLGPGDDFYLWWGHIALVIEDRLNGEERFYDWGVFSFETDNFYRNFAFGRLIYSCRVSRAEANYTYGVYLNRDITVYTLDLPAEKKRELYAFAENNILPENCDYRYHLFDDNCSTRIRDLIDMATDGAFGARYRTAPGRFTLREHARRFTWFSPFGDWLLSFGMGQRIDRPARVWDEMFLPSELAMRIGDFVYTDASGLERTLTSSVETLNKASGRPEALVNAPSAWTPLSVTLGMCFAVLAVFFSFAINRKLFRVLRGVYQSLLGLSLGGAGSLLFFMTFFTDHEYTYRNSNVLFLNPLLLAAVPAGLVFAFAKKAKTRAVCETLLKALWTLVFLGGVISALIKISPAFYQQNQAVQILVMPFAFVLSFLPACLFRAARRKREGGA